MSFDMEPLPLRLEELGDLIDDYAAQLKIAQSVAQKTIAEQLFYRYCNLVIDLLNLKQIPRPPPPRDPQTLTPSQKERASRRKAALERHLCSKQTKIRIAPHSPAYAALA
jgi:hypothetical protein